ncbi:MAG TPA: hypothetical protein VGU45_16230 [Microvirga sp.]|jgi:hypothetical protein|nr:hypothetical protein [Microvirga sp.]
MTTRLPAQPHFEAIEAAALDTASRRTLILALIGNISFSWSNNESMFIYVIMLLLDTDETAAAIVFSTLNTTRARLDLVERLAAVKISDREIAARLKELIERFDACNRVRNELNHSMYVLNETGEITHTQSMRITGSRGRLKFGGMRPVDDGRLREMEDVIAGLRALNRDLWAFLPALESHLNSRRERDS